MKKMFALALSIAMLFCLAACGSRTSENPDSTVSGDTDWPKKTIQLVVPYSAGGDTDYYARATAAALEKVLGTTVAVINTSGASGTTGALSVLDQDADGYCFLFGHESVLYNQAAGTVPFDYLTDFVAVGSPLIDASYSLMCSADAPYQTLKELSEYCKENPGTVTAIGSAGASSGWAAWEMCHALGDIEWRLVEGPSSSSEKLAGFLSGQYDLITGNFSQYRDYVIDGQMTCLGNYGSVELESMAELGIQNWLSQGFDYVDEHLFMIRAKAGTDQAIIDKMASALQQVVENEDFIETVSLFGGTVKWTNGESCTEFEQNYYDSGMAYISENS